MVSNLDRRIEALESLPGGGKPATRMTDREVLAVVAPDHSGPMPSDMPAMVYAWMKKPRPAQAPPDDGLSAQERYMRMVNRPKKGGAHGNA